MTAFSLLGEPFLYYSFENPHSVEKKQKKQPPLAQSSPHPTCLLMLRLPVSDTVK